MIKKILLLTIISFTINYIYSQKDTNDLYLQLSTDEESNINDRVYYSTNWGAGNIIRNDSSLLFGLSFRYDVKNDRFEMWSYVNPESITILTMNGKFFIHTEYMYKKTYKRKGYFQIIANGYAKLLLKRSTKTIQGKKGAYGYKARQAVIETYFLKIGNKPAIKLDIKKKDIAELFPNHKEKINKYVINNHISLRRNFDMIELVNYYNLLIKKS